MTLVGSVAAGVAALFGLAVLAPFPPEHLQTTQVVCTATAAIAVAVACFFR